VVRLESTDISPQLDAFVRLVRNYSAQALRSTAYMEIPGVAAVWNVRSQAVLLGPSAVVLGTGFRLWPIV
jgi:hypothetical protein